MTPRGKGSPPDRFRQVQTVKTLALSSLLVGVLAVSAYVVVRAGISQNPLSVPLDQALAILLLGIVAYSGLHMVFRALELTHAPKEGQKYLLAESSWRAAKRALGVAAVLAVFFAIPAASALVENVLSPTHPRELDAGESLPVRFVSQDPLALTKASALRVSVQTGSLRVEVANATEILNPGGTLLTAGTQRSLLLPTGAYTVYTVTFENAANATTMFTYRVDVGFPPGFPTLVLAVSASIAGANFLWLLYLRGVRERLPKPKPTLRPVAPAVPRATPRPGGAMPWFQRPRTWRPLYQPPRASATPHAVATTPRSPPPRPRTPPPPKPKGRPVDSGKPPAAEPPASPEAPPAPPVDISSLMDKAEGQLSSGEYKEALGHIETVLRMDSHNVRALLIKAELLRRSNKPGEAIEQLDRALSLDLWQHRALLTKGYLLEEQGRHDEALECYEAILAGSPEYVEAFARKGEIMFHMNELELAIEAYEEAVRLNPDDAELQQRLHLLQEERKDPLDRARVEMTLGEPKAAEPLFLRALEGPRASEARRDLVDLYLEAGREQEALAHLKDALRETPDDVDLLLRRVKALTQLGQLSAALDASKAACEGAPDQAAVWAIRGALEADLGRIAEARRSFRTAVDLDPDDAESARALHQLRQDQSDQEELQEVLRGLEGVPKQAVEAVQAAFSTLKDLKAAKVKALVSLEGVSEDAAKAILRAVRKGG